MDDTIGWAQLDEANKADGHYRRYPTQIAQAAEMYRAASALYDRICDQYEAGTADGFDIAEAWDAYLIVNRLQSHRYDRWQIDLTVALAGGECECIPTRDTACPACHAQARLMSWQ